MASKIEWTDATWNPVVGCQIVSPGCTNCYAMKMAGRLELMGTAPHYAGTTQKTKAGFVWTGKVAAAPDKSLFEPLRWRRPRRIFVNSMGDLFADGVPERLIDQVWAVMAVSPHHIYQVLTKRAEAMRDYVSGLQTAHGLQRLLFTWVEHPTGRRQLIDLLDAAALARPLPNVWLGVSAEDHPRARERVPVLLQTPSAVRFVSLEPMISDIDLTCLQDEFGWIDALRGERHASRPGDYQIFKWLAKLNLVIVGGESGHRSRPSWMPYIRSIIRQCEAAQVAVFVKQLGANVQDRNDAGFDGMEPHHWPHIDPADVEHDLSGRRDGYQGAPVRIRLRNRKGADMSEWPQDLRVRQLPEVVHG